ncbi:hypothetical protein XENORESO_021750 [Xenotaenia resolanae]|uniref:Uncharacterized protein n=1 Tax=Xenotaenia resolanae TaxID=208358 RepID=A0ABV0X1I9_9TELE
MESMELLQLQASCHVGCPEQAAAEPNRPAAELLLVTSTDGALGGQRTLSHATFRHAAEGEGCPFKLNRTHRTAVLLQRNQLPSAVDHFKSIKVFLFAFCQAQ